MTSSPPSIRDALTFDDVLLQPGHSEVLPSDVDISAPLTRELRLNLPLISAAMDTVTEHRLAITMAQAGGIGVIHKNFSIEEQAAEVAAVAERARNKQLKPDDMQGGVFTVSSLGAIGGRGFTPIINAPEVAILGVGRAAVQPVWDGEVFRPHTLLPLALSYDHRVVNGGDGGRFLTELTSLLGDVKRMVM